MVVSIIHTKNAAGLKDYAGLLEQKIKSRFSQNSIINTRDIAIDSKESLVFDYKVVSDGIPLRGTSFLLKNGNEICMINCMEMDEHLISGKIYHSLFMDMVQSISWN